MVEFAFERGDQIQVRSFAYSTAGIVVRVYVRYEDGTYDIRKVTATHTTGDGTRQLFLADDEAYLQERGVVYALATDVEGTAHRGIIYLQIFIHRGEGERLPIAAFSPSNNFFGGLGYFEPQPWVTWVYVATITNDGSNSGNHEYEITPGVGGEVKEPYGSLLNGDGSARSSFAYVRDDDDTNIAHITPPTLSITAAQTLPFPVIDEVASNAASFFSRLMTSGLMKFYFALTSIAVSQDTALRISCRIRGAIPTVTLTSPTDAVEVVVKNQVF